MRNKFLSDASKICAQTSSFGEVLEQIRQERNLTQEQLGKKIYRSKAWVSRLISNQIPQKFGITDIHHMADILECNEIELAELVRAFACYILSSNDLIDLDII